MKKRTVTINKADSLVSIKVIEPKATYPSPLAPMPVIKCSWEDYKKGGEIAHAKGRED
tara:strand:+ start:309 stop:482 length:174 start_codon:yes stop_codon:yes gene_type:complete